MVRRKKSPLKPTEDNGRYNLRKKIEAVKAPKQIAREVSSRSITVASKSLTQKKTTSATTISTVTPMGPARNVRSDTSVVTIDTTIPIGTPATINGNSRLVEDTVADVVTRIAEKSVEYRELKESVGLLNDKMDTVIDQMAKESYVKQDTRNEVEGIKQELQKQKDDFNEIKATLADFVGMMNRAMELLQRKEQENTSVLEMSAVESENISMANNDEMNESVQEYDESSGLSTIAEESHITTEQTNTSMMDTVTQENNLSTVRSIATVTHRGSVSIERSTPTLTNRNTMSMQRSTPTVTQTQRNSKSMERYTSTVTPMNTMLSERGNPSSEFSPMTIMDESPLTNSPQSEDSSRAKKHFKRITFASSSLANTPSRADLTTDGERREGSLASLLCDSIRRRGSSLATSGLSGTIGESPAISRLSGASSEVSDQITSETRARRSSMDLARHILEKRTNLRSTNTLDDSVILQNATPARRVQKTPDSIICLGTPYRPTPPMINLVTSYNECTPRRTITYRARSSTEHDNSLDLQSAKNSLRRTNNETVELDILNTTVRAEDPNTSTTSSDT